MVGGSSPKSARRSSYTFLSSVTHMPAFPWSPAKKRAGEPRPIAASTMIRLPRNTPSAHDTQTQQGRAQKEQCGRFGDGDHIFLAIFMVPESGMTGEIGIIPV